MSCEWMERLIPLYVEGDLRPRQTERVRSHLGGCLRCCKTVEAYRESQRWLREKAAVQLPGVALDRMRAALQRRIDAVPPRSPFWLQIERGWALLRQWTSQPAVSVAAVFVVVLGSVAVSQVVGPRRGNELVEARPAEAEAPAAARVAEHEAIGGPGNEVSGPADELAVDGLLAQASPDELADAAGESGGGVLAGEDDGDDEMRIEIQTRDPNVRIIWFTPPDKSGAMEN